MERKIIGNAAVGKKKIYMEKLLSKGERKVSRCDLLNEKINKINKIK